MVYKIPEGDPEGASAYICVNLRLDSVSLSSRQFVCIRGCYFVRLGLRRAVKSADLNLCFWHRGWMF
jgi:hypothetical protein